MIVLALFHLLSPITNTPIPTQTIASTLDRTTNDFNDPTQPEVACNDTTNEWTQNSNDLMEDIITSNEMKVNDVQIINNYQQQQQAFVDTNIAQMDDTNTESEQIEKIEEVQAGINGYHNNNDNNNDQSVQADIILNNDNVKEEEEDNNEQQQQQQQEEDDLSKDV